MAPYPVHIQSCCCATEGQGKDFPLILGNVTATPMQSCAIYFGDTTPSEDEQPEAAPHCSQNRVEIWHKCWAPTPHLTPRNSTFATPLHGSLPLDNQEKGVQCVSVCVCLCVFCNVCCPFCVFISFPSDSSIAPSHPPRPLKSAHALILRQLFPFWAYNSRMD